MGYLLKDFRHAARTLAARPGFTVVAVASLALGIGLNTTIFSLVNAVLIRPAPVERPSELVEVYTSKRGGNEIENYSTHSYLDYVDYRDGNDVFSGLAGHSLMLASWSESGRSELLIGEIVTWNYFDVLGVRPLLGRTLLPEEDRTPGAHPVAVLGHEFWQSRFAGDPGTLGRTIRLNGKAFVVVGVLPPEFAGMTPGFSPALWVPSMMAEDINPMGMQDTDGTPKTTSRLQERGRRWMFLTGRLRPGISMEQAQAHMAALAAGLEKQYPDTNKNRTLTLLRTDGVRFHPVLDAMLTPVAAVLLGVVGIVLLVACANVANMLLARATTRRKEISIRLAIGATRARLIRQLLAESLLLAGLGGTCGLVLAYWTTGLLQAFRPPLPLTITVDLGIDIRVLLFTLVVSVLTGLFFGLAPALQASRTDLVSSLKEVTSEKKPGRFFGMGSLLVVGQVALSLVLLVGAGLLLRSFEEARDIDLGFDAEAIGLFSMDLEMNGYDEDQARLFYERALERVRSLPGVESAAVATRLPLGIEINLNDIWVDGHELTPDEETPFAVDVAFVDDAYFETLGISLLEGRHFERSDTQDSPRVAVVNEAFARRFWPTESAIGKRIRTRTIDGLTYEIVGVARNHRIRSVGEAERPYVHFARAQRFNSYGTIAYRSKGEPAGELETVRRELLSLDPDLLVVESGTMDDRLALSLFPVRAGSQILGGFSLLAVLLASVGLYGLIAYWVSQRTREVGIRIAMGADSRSILAFVLQRGMILGVIGVVLGLGGAAAVSQVLRGVLYGIHPLDPATYVAASALLLTVVLLANAVPARRAARVDPVVALRYE